MPQVGYGALFRTEQNPNATGTQHLDAWCNGITWVENNMSNVLCGIGAANKKERSLFFSVSEVKSGITPRIVCAHSRRGGVIFPRAEKVNLIVRLVKSCSTIIE